MQHLYVGPRRDAARMELVCGIRPGQVYACYIRHGGCRCTLGRTPAIRRSIWFVLLCFPNRTAGHVCIPKLLCLYLFNEAMPAGARAKLPFYLGHVVGDHPHYALVVPAPVPHH